MNSHRSQSGQLTRAALRPLVRILTLVVAAGALTACFSRAPTTYSTPTLAPFAARASGTDGTAPVRPRADTSVTLYLLGTTDVHGHMLPFDYYTGKATSYGLALLAPVVDSVRAAHPDAIYLFDSGDLLQGTPLTYLAARPAAAGPRAKGAAPEPNPVIRAMNLLEYDVSAVGNHEYNYGLGTLDSAMEQAHFAFVAANVYEHGKNSPAYGQYALLPHVVSEGDTILVGVTGITPPGVMVWDRGNVENRLDFRDPVAALKPVVADMKARGADMVVVLNHGGFAGTSYDTASTGIPAENAGARIAREVPGVDVVFLGHTHGQVSDSTINGVLFTQAGAWARSLAVADVTLTRRGPSDWVVAKKAARLLRPATSPSQALVDSLRWAHERAAAYVRAPIGRATAALEGGRARAEDTPLIDFVNEVQRRVTGADLSAASAFTDAGIAAGPITIGEVAAVYPYENTLTAVRITGAQLKAYLEKAAEYFNTWPVQPGASVINRSVVGYNFDQVAGVDYTIDVSKPVGKRVAGLTYKGQPVRPDQSFTIALNSYRRGGGGGYSMVAGAPVVWQKDQDIRELLIDEVRRKGTIRPEDYFRRSWRIVPAAAAEQIAKEVGAEGSRRGLAASSAGSASAKRLRVLTTNDLHGHLLPETYAWSGGRPVGGAATLAAYFRAEREGFGGPTILLDAGDEMQGTPVSNLTQGRSTVDFFDGVAEGAAAIGNHEFDWGVPVLRQRITKARYAWMAANIVVAGTDTAPSWVHGTTTLDVDGVKVGVIGLATPETPNTTKFENVKGLQFGDGAATIDRLVPELRRKGADFVVVVAHSGGFCDPSGAKTCRGEIVDWASRVHEKPDLIVAGHTHTVMRTVVNGIPIVQAGSYGQRYGVVDLEKATSSDAARVAIRDVPVAYADRLVPDSAVGSLVARYQREIGPRVNAVVATLAEPIRKSAGEFPLGRLLADAWRAETGAQIAFINNGGVRSELKAGPVTWANLFEVLPFQNRLVVLTLTGAKLRQAVETAVGGNLPDLNVSGLRVTYDPAKIAGSRLVTIALADGSPVRDDATYTAAMQDFLAGGGDKYVAFTAPIARKDTGIVDLDGFIDFLKKQPQPVRAPQDARLVPVGAAEATR